MATRTTVRWLTSKQRKGGATAPFEGQLMSATERHRLARRQQQLEASSVMAKGTETERLKATRKQILDGAGISQAHLESATVLHRRNRRTIEVESRKGSAAAVMSATTQYRLQRKLPPRGEQDHMVNPSDLSLPITSETINEGDSRGKIQHASKSAKITMHTNRVERTAFRSLSLIVVIATAAAFGIMFHS